CRRRARTGTPNRMIINDRGIEVAPFMIIPLTREELPNPGTHSSGTVLILFIFKEQVDFSRTTGID
ncbi:hypothetical protein KA005_29955, partial [bacterium]|nr:hypothetical protein [bacterium]